MQPLTPLAPSCRCAHSEFANYDPAVNVAEPCAQVSVKFIATISGELADFDADAFAARVAARVGLPAPSLVNVTATAGSVVATATFTEPSPELAAISSALLSFASPAAAASALNVEVEATQVSYDPSPEALVVPVPAGGWRQGCMAPAADSYDPLANWHDQGLCTFAPRGCMNSTAANFAPGATLPAECVTYTPATSSGCLIPTALNYNSAVAVHESAPAWSNGPGSMDHGHSAWLAAGCPCGQTPLQRPSRLLKAALGPRGRALAAGMPTRGWRWRSVAPPTAADATAVARAGAACMLSLVGCADSTADNFLSDVTVAATSLVDGACFVGVRGCSAPGATNFDSTATVDDGTCHMQVPHPPPPPPSPPSPESPPTPPAPPPAPPAPPSPPPSPPPPSLPPPCVWEPQSANCLGLMLLRGISSPEICAETCCGDPLCEVWQVGGAGETTIQGCRYGVPTSCSQSYGYATHGGRRYAARPPMPPGAMMPSTASNGSLVAGGEDAEGDGAGLNGGTGLDTLLFGALIGGGLLGGGLLGCALLAALRRCRRRQIQVDMRQSKRHPASGTRRVVPWSAAAAATPTDQAAATAADIAIADRAIAAAAIAAALAEPTPPAAAPSKGPRKTSWTAAFAKWRGKKSASDKYAAPSPTPTPVKPPRASCTATRMCTSVSSASSAGSRAPPPSVPPFQLTFQPSLTFRAAPQPPPSGCSASTAAARATAARAAAAFPTRGGADADASAASEAGIRARPALGSRSSSMGSSSSSLVGDGTPERITLSRRPSRDFAPRTLHLETGDEPPPRPAPLKRQAAGLGPDFLGPAFHGPGGGLSGEQMSDRIMSGTFRPNETMALSLPNFGLSAEALDNITPEVSSSQPA